MWRVAVEGGRPGESGGFIRSASWHSLRQLMLLRNFAIVGQTLAILVAQGFFAVPLPMAALASASGFLVLVNLATFWRLRRSWPVTDLEVLGQISMDIGALTALLYFSGGATNPFAGLFLLPLAIAAATLPWRHTLSVGLLTLACYSLLVFFHVPLPGPRHGAEGFLVFGAWVNYLVCAALIAYLVLTIASRLREQKRSLAEARQRDLNDQYLIRVGSLAAGAAHEIGSPLCTIAVLVKELLLQRHDERRDLTQNLRLMSDQIDACRRSLSDLVTCRQDVLVNGEQREPVDRFLHESAGGSLKLFNRPGGGARAEVVLPLGKTTGVGDEDYAATAPFYKEAIRDLSW